MGEKEIHEGEGERVREGKAREEVSTGWQI